MSKESERLSALRREMSAGRGGSLQPYPVSQEPLFTPFDPLKPKNDKAKIPIAPRTAASTSELTFLRLRPSEEDRYSVELAEQLLRSLSLAHPVAFELLGVAGDVHIQVAAASRDANAVANQLEAHYQECEVFASADVISDAELPLRCARGYGLSRSHVLPLGESKRTEPYTALVGLLGGLGPGDIALFQVVFVPVRNDWRGNIMRVARDPFDPAKSAFYDAPQLPKRAEAKVAKPLFAVSVRTAASSKDLLDRLERSFISQFQGEENGLESMPEPYPVEAMMSRTTHASGMILNVAELATLTHVPNPDDVPEALETAEPGAPPPELSTRDILVPLGWNRYRGVGTPVGISGVQLSRHMAIFGGTGYGKTNLMQIAFEKHIEQGGGLATLDFKGDFSQGLIDRIPEHRVKDVVLFDPTDPEFAPALNVLEGSSGLSNEGLTAELMVGLKRLFRGSSEFGPRMEWILRNAVRTLLASEGEKTLYDIPHFLEDAPYRDSVLSTVGDRGLREFWQRRKLSPTVIDPVLNRLSSFLDRPTIRDIVAQPNRIDFRKIMREKKIFIANLEKGILQDAAFVLGSFILSRLQLAALARRPDERSLFPIICDEFHNLAGHGMATESIETFLSEARSYLVPLVVSTQYVGRLNKDVITAIFGNVGTLVCMHLGQIDAQAMQRELGEFSAEDLLDLGIGEAIVRVGSARDAFNVTIPLAQQRVSYREAITRLSRESYCRPKSEVEAMLRLAPEESVSESRGLDADTTPDEGSFLEYVSSHPDVSLSRVATSLGLGGGRASRIRRSLQKQGFLLEVETNQGEKGNRAKYGVVTRSGLKAAKIQGRSGRGGPVHRHYQALIRQLGEARGYNAEIERPLPNGGAVDVHLERDEISTAVEISVSTSNEGEARNVLQALEAGYDQVLCLFLDEQRIPEMNEALSTHLTPQIAQRVTLAPVASFRDHL